MPGPHTPAPPRAAFFRPGHNRPPALDHVAALLPDIGAHIAARILDRLDDINLAHHRPRIAAVGANIARHYALMLDAPDSPAYLASVQAIGMTHGHYGIDLAWYAACVAEAIILVNAATDHNEDLLPARDTWTYLVLRDLALTVEAQTDEQRKRRIRHFAREE